MTDRAKIAARIRALRAKTVENGCTEGEALAAAEMLAKLLEQYNMTLDEAEMRASSFDHHTEQHEDAVGDRLWRAASAIAELTNARYWVSPPGVFPVKIDFFGFSHEVEVARYLLEICANAMRGQRDRIDREKGLYTRRRERRYLYPFLDGMVERLAERLRAMKPKQPVGRGLMVLHRDLVDRAMKDAGHSTRTGRGRAGRDVFDGYTDGLHAGDRVALNRGLRGNPVAAGLLR